MISADYYAAKVRYSTLNAAALKAKADSYRIEAEMEAIDPSKTPENRPHDEAFYLNLAFDYDAMARNAMQNAAEWAKDAAEAARAAA